MKVITVANQKGGVAKPPTATSLAAILTSWGKKALMIDADEQCNTTDTYRAKIEGVASLYDLILDEDPCSIEDAIQHTEFGDIIAGDPGLATAESVLSKDRDYSRLDTALKSLKGYEYVIIDTHPSVNSILYTTLAASDSVIIPLYADRYSLSGISMLLDTIYEVKNKLNARLRIDGILMCRIDNRRVLDKDFQKEIEALKEEIGVNVFRTRIRETIKCRESQVKRTPLIFYAPDCTAEEDYENLVTELTGIRRK